MLLRNLYSQRRTLLCVSLETQVYATDCGASCEMLKQEQIESVWKMNQEKASL